MRSLCGGDVVVATFESILTAVTALQKELRPPENHQEVFSTDIAGSITLCGGSIQNSRKKNEKLGN